MSGYPKREYGGASGDRRFSHCSNLGSPEASLERLRTGRLGYRAFKRTFDIGFSLAALILFSWLFLLIAFAIKLDDPTGPAIFKQVRVGRDGSEFVCYKFRSMHVDAESLIEELMVCNEKDAPVFKMRRDPRITRVGRVLRKASLDELPQFWNVLKGDMSVVGPRPALPRELPGYPARALPRFGIRPGITCYWQTRRNRDSITFDEWMDLDLLYLQKAGIWTDIKLIIQTVGCVLTFQGE
ncbi:sugar transferase [Enorma phocaeensis]|uniref:sugar transferase n=1 Tax=Enorma phocaeensis TaxID=1871019 RepID=UPI001C63BA76|nr:sugar transferase [Enorma phocaeensis]